MSDLNAKYVSEFLKIKCEAAPRCVTPRECASVRICLDPINPIMQISKNEKPKCKHGFETCVECNFGILISNDSINHPSHYTQHASGVECITVTRHMNFNLGNAMKYIWRFDKKDSTVDDLKKARWYIDDEIKRLEVEKK